MPWPSQRRSASFAGFQERPSVFRFFFLVQLVQDRAEKDPFDEDVLLEDHLFARIRAQPLEQPPDRLRPFRPFHWSDNSLHIGDAADAVGMPVRPVEPQSRSPIVEYQGNRTLRDHRVGPGIQIVAVLDEPV